VDDDVVLPLTPNLVLNAGPAGGSLQLNTTGSLLESAEDQMQAEALKLRSAINRIERLLDHNLALTDQILSDRVETKINEKEKTLDLHELKLDHIKVDWSTLIHAASYRLPPFSPGEKEKGFRDAIVAESFLQLVADSPKTTKLRTPISG
jgi:hypothetical protein